jgi:hypothetical protein
MSLETRIKDLEGKLPKWMTPKLMRQNADVFQMSNTEMKAIIAEAPFDLTLLTAAELTSLDAWLSEPKTDAPLPPDIEAMLERIQR